MCAGGMGWATDIGEAANEAQKRHVGWIGLLGNL
jgi:hypothetical protein